MRNVLYAILCGTLAFLVLGWRNTGDVHAAVTTPAAAGRCELVQLHPNANSEWSGVLDTETGCTWVFTANNPDDPEIKDRSYKLFVEVLGGHSFDLVNFDTSDYIPLQMTGSAAASAQNAGPTVSYSSQIHEINRVQSLCSKARIKALESAAGD